jgi:hypothetical protein
MAELLMRWVTEVPPRRLQKVRRVLAAIEKDPEENPYLPFAKCSMVHFASFTLFDEASPPLLVFESNIDRPFGLYVKRLVEVGRKGLDIIYEGARQGFRCYPAPPADAAVERFFRKLKRGPQLFHIGHPDRSVQEIRGDCELRQSIALELATDLELKSLVRTHSPADVVREIRRRANCPSWFWSWGRRPWNAGWQEADRRKPVPLRDITWMPDKWPWWGWFFRVVKLAFIAWIVATSVAVVGDTVTGQRNAIIVLEALLAFASMHFGPSHTKMRRAALVSATLGSLVALPFYWAPFAKLTTDIDTAFLLALLVLPTLLLISFLWLLWRLMVSKWRFEPLNESTRQRTHALLEAEDVPERHGHYNHVAGLSELEPRFRWFRCVRTWLALCLLNLFYRTEYVKGKLVTIPSIHFAQWSLVNGRYLLFLTNYDGPADSYLDDFFNSLGLGVAFIWQDTRIFPMTIDPRRLKLWVREGQTPATARYRAAAYDGLTVGAINGNTFIRRRLLRGWRDASARRWLRYMAAPAEQSPSAAVPRRSQRQGMLSRFIQWARNRAAFSG